MCSSQLCRSWAPQGLLKTQLRALGFYKDGDRFLSIVVKSTPVVITWGEVGSHQSARKSLQVRYLALEGFPQQTTHAASWETGKVMVRATKFEA